MQFNRLKRSGRTLPCPICSRKKDGDCAFNDQVVFCHQGGSQGPPASLNIGDTVEKGEKVWALVKTDSGPTGRAYVFKPHQASRRCRHQSGKTDSAWKNEQQDKVKSALDIFFIAWEEAWAVKDFYQLSPDELKDGIAKINNVYTASVLIWKYIHQHEIWRNYPDLCKEYKDRFETFDKSARWQFQNLQDFRRELGEIC